MIDFEKERYSLDDLVTIVAILRGEGGCPWDREQTHESIRRNFLEEAYEAVEAIDEADPAHLREELGDVMLQVAFHAQIESEAGRFGIDDVANEICRKLIRRHPHIFADVKVSGSGEVLSNWDAIKRAEKSQKSTGEAMDSVARSLPSLWRAEKVQHKAAKAGFDWPDVSGALDKLAEELDELREAVASGEGRKEELGDLLFAAVNVARFVDVDPEEALNASSEKFIARYRGLETLAASRGLDTGKMSLEELDKLYEEAKAALKSTGEAPGGFKA